MQSQIFTVCTILNHNRLIALFAAGELTPLDGAPQAQIARQIREELGSYIWPSRKWSAPALPNFFTEAKGPTGSSVVSERQACYAGVLGARGMHRLRTFATEDMYDNNAYTITSTYCSFSGGILRIFATRPIPSTNPAKRPCDYHTSQLGGWVLTGSRKQFCEGVGAFRNARDWAKEQREKAIAAANARLSPNTDHVHNQLRRGLVDGRLKPQPKRRCSEDSSVDAPQPKRRLFRR